MIVIGAGMAGLLAAGMLRSECTRVVEAQPEIPNNHSAVLRFRSSVVGDSLNIRFKEVKAVKAVDPWRNPVADAIAYSKKTNGSATLRSVISADAAPATRYIAPPDMVQQMAERVTAPFQFGAQFLWGARHSAMPVISTIPMPSLMAVLGWKEVPEFRSVEGANYGCTVPGANAYCSVYVPDPSSPIARVSITGDQLVAEVYGDQPGDHDPAVIFSRAFAAVGLGESAGLAAAKDGWVKAQKYAKILPIDEELRREFIMWCSEKHNVYPLGRFATWRPGLLLDDLVNDVRVIQRLASDRGAVYPHKLKKG